MKADGIEYEERMELLEDVTYPQAAGRAARRRPTRSTGGATRGSPTTSCRPKSVVRDMYERAMTFAEYVAFYGLARSEGLVLRYLADAYKALRQTVPDEARTEELDDLIEWLGELVRQVDSSLLDEWERLREPADDGRRPSAWTSGPPPVTGNVRAFRVLVRNALFRRVELAALRRYDELGELDVEAGLGRRRLGRTRWSRYFDEHDEIGTGPDARGPAC